MAWTAPRSWTTGEKVTAAIMTSAVKDNQNALHTGAMALTSQAVGDLLVPTSATQLGRLADVATGQILISGGVGVTPAWSATPSVTTITAGSGASGGNVKLGYDDGSNLWLQTVAPGSNRGIKIDCQGTGTVTIIPALTVTGVATLTAQPICSTLTASLPVFSDSSKGLVSNAMTGTDNVVMSASPTLTGTIDAVDMTLSGLTASLPVSTNGSQQLITSPVTGTGNVVMSASPTLTGTLGAAEMTLSGLTASLPVSTNGSQQLITAPVTGTGTSVVLSAGPTLTGTLGAVNALLSGTLGMGTTPAGWSGRSVIQLGTAGMINFGAVPANGGSTGVGNNQYWNGSADKATIDGYSCLLGFNTAGTGTIQTLTTSGTSSADATISFTAGPYVAAGGTSWTDSSDARIKSNFVVMSNVLPRVVQMLFGEFTWTQSGQADYGAKAQEVVALFPAIVDPGDDAPIYDKTEAGSKLWGVRESKYGVIALAAIQEQQVLIDALTARIVVLEAA